MERDCVAMQGTHAGLLAQNPTGPPVVQYTTVNMGAAAKPPMDHVIWSIFNFVNFNFCCLGLVALIFSFKARDRKMLGDLQGAQSYGSTARNLNIAVTLLFCLCVGIAVICFIAATGK